MSTQTLTGAKNRLMSEYKDLAKEKWVHIELDDAAIFKWEVGLMVINTDSVFNGGYFKAVMTFDSNYPYSPPSFKFTRPPYHPNIYADGKLCISILHPPQEDEQSGEHVTERWSPLQGVESVLRSILLLLDDPETSSAANVDAGVLFRDDRPAYNQKARALVQESLQDIPEGFVMPKALETAPPAKIANDDSFWAESDEELDFGGSDTDEADEGVQDQSGEEEEEEL